MFAKRAGSFVELETARTLIRLAMEEDATPLYQAARSPGFLTWMSWDEPDSEATLREHFRVEQRNWRAGKSCSLTVVELGSGLVVGGVRLKLEVEDTKAGGEALDIGYWTHPKHQRLGFASEYLPRVASFAFTDLGANALFAAVAHENEPSRRLLQRLGFEAFEERPQCTPSKRFKNTRYRLQRATFITSSIAKA